MKTITIPPSFFTRNRYRLSLKLKSHSLAIIHSHDAMNRTTDQYFPFRQHSDLFYFTGINQEKTTLLLAPDHPDENLREVLLILRSDEKLETWEGHKLTPEEAGDLSGIRTVKFQDELDSVLAPLMISTEHVYLNLPEYPKFIPELPDRDLRLGKELMARFPAHHYDRLAPVIRDLRIIKSEEEISLIRQACDITRDAFMRVPGLVRPGIAEYEVEARLIYEFLRQGARGHAFPPIIATGRNACFLHYTENNSTLSDGDLLLMDFGAEYGNYAADCTRTIPVNGRFTPRQKDLYAAVLDTYQYACTLIKPGYTINRVHAEVCRKMGREHVKLGLYTAAELESQDARKPLYQKYYMHGTSHFLGLDVHDAGSKEAEFRPGMVLTCEPGIYLTGENTGIRLENTLLITGDGCENLMKDIPMEISEVEEAMSKKG